MAKIKMCAQNKKTFKKILLLSGVVVYLLFIVCRDKSVGHYKRGTAHAKKGEYDQAILCFDKAIKINPRFAKAYCNRGIAYAQKGEYDKSILDFNKVSTRKTHVYSWIYKFCPVRRKVFLRPFRLKNFREATRKLEFSRQT